MDCDFIRNLTKEQKAELLKLLSDEPAKKYEFTGKTIRHYHYTLRQIRRISDGVVGGYIESEENLSQEGNCWVAGSAQVYSDARVYGKAQVYGDVLIHNTGSVSGNIRICGKASSE
ncbi:hypothetical protein LCGC14_2848110 [marine sediment metagenome]|uniref:Polymer-forming cytoskeletal protein n=1 Tax=marine sediment metagenome TaxID=412755 RepID=A0A0F8YW04_9ZZZZ